MDISSFYVREIKISKEVPRESGLAALPVVRHLKTNGISFTRPVSFFVASPL